MEGAKTNPVMGPSNFACVLYAIFAIYVSCNPAVGLWVIAPTLFSLDYGLTAMCSRKLTLDASCLSPKFMFKSYPGHVRCNLAEKVMKFQIPRLFLLPARNFFAVR